MNKKGFSFVELLGVIVILGILALIATPIVTSTIDDSRKSGFKSSLTGIKKAIETDYSEHKFDTSRKYKYENKKLIETTSGEQIEISGHISSGKGKGSINSSGVVKFGAYTDKYCGIINGNETKLAGEGSYTFEQCKSEVDSIN